MARQPMVTRTIQTTHATVLCLNIPDAEPFNQTVVLPRTYKDEKAMMKIVEKLINTDDVKSVHIVDIEVHEALYGMTEAYFIATAHPIPKNETPYKKVTK